MYQYPEMNILYHFARNGPFGLCYCSLCGISPEGILLGIAISKELLMHKQALNGVEGYGYSLTPKYRA